RKKDLRVYNKPLVLLFFGTMLFSQPQFTSRKKKFDQYCLQAEKRHRSREKNLLSKKLRPLNGIKEPSRPGEHRNRL
ncbi:hypothetical protein, partial [Coprococcus comes]